MKGIQFNRQPRRVTLRDIGGNTLKDVGHADDVIGADDLDADAQMPMSGSDYTSRSPFPRIHAIDTGGYAPEDDPLGHDFLIESYVCEYALVVGLRFQVIGLRRLIAFALIKRLSIL